MYIFKLMQVLDPCVVHVPLRRELIGTETLGVVVEQLLDIFEIPLHTPGLACLGLEDIKNSFVVFKVSGLCANVWREMTQGYTREQNKNGQRPVDYSLGSGNDWRPHPTPPKRKITNSGPGPIFFPGTIPDIFYPVF